MAKNAQHRWRSAGDWSGRCRFCPENVRQQAACSQQPIRSAASSCQSRPAEMRVSLRFRPAFSRSIKRGRGTSLVLSPVEGSGRTGGYRVWFAEGAFPYGKYTITSPQRQRVMTCGDRISASGHQWYTAQDSTLADHTVMTTFPWACPFPIYRSVLQKRLRLFYTSKP